MNATLVDSNVILDVLTENEEWLDWSSSQLAKSANAGMLVINPIIWISGLLYLFWAELAGKVPAGLGLEQVAIVHTLGAFLMLAFLIIHMYLATAGHTVFAHIKAMITGWEDADEENTAVVGAARKQGSRS